MFDELDVKAERSTPPRPFRSLLAPDRVVIAWSRLGINLSDFICVLYGVPEAYGVVTMPFSVQEGINIFLDGFVPTENLRSREGVLDLKGV
ncbi:ATP-binding cassette sub-family E member 1 [Orchesella cincta]|uniref:ATP-binding cassette sub-family E member 1 n=1 Tax=Orchesella cincta TaxID=48709 RepID=A0A1D2M5Z8_ORCCI|nr:ATP-binding cassette sub-family E member 1 [Orchesella cincta]